MKYMAEVLGILWKALQEKQQNFWKHCTCQHKQFSHAHLAYTCIDLDYIQKKQMKDIKFLQKLLTCFFASVPDCSAGGNWVEDPTLMNSVGEKTSLMHFAWKYLPCSFLMVVMDYVV